MPFPPITPLPPAPLRSAASEDDYVAVADTWAAALDPWTDDLNAAGDYIDNAVATFDGTATEAETELNAIVAAANAAFNAKLALAGFRGTSTTSMAVSTGAKSFVMQSGLSFGPGSTVTIADTAAPGTNYMLSYINTYDPANGNTTATAVTAVGTGTKTAWTITVSPSGLEYATVADVWAGTVANKVVTPKLMADAQAPVDLGNITGTVTLDLHAGWNFKAVLVGNVTFADPTNKIAGRTYVLDLTQDGTGSRTAAFNTAIKKSAPITLATAAGARDKLIFTTPTTSIVDVVKQGPFA